MNVAIPLFGKMIFRTYHNSGFVGEIRRSGVEPIFCVRDLPSDGRIHHARYEHYLVKELGLLERWLVGFRHLAGHPEVSDMRFRDRIYSSLFSDVSIVKWYLSVIAMDMLRRQRWLAKPSILLSKRLADCSSHAQFFDSNDISAVLTSGVGSAGFDTVNPFVYEAQRRKIPIVVSVTNYDNILSRGYRGFMPDVMAVWSKQMKDDAVSLLDIPSDRIEITGPVQFDRYFDRLTQKREEFLSARGLDPAKQTIVYAGGANLLNSLHFLRLLSGPFRERYMDCNIIIRPHPDPRLSKLPVAWCLRELKCTVPNLYVSDPLMFSADSINASNDVDELHGLLRHSDVILHHYSTLGLEAAICDLPTVYVKYDPCDFFHYWSTTSRWQSRQVHNKRSLRKAAGREVESDEDTMETLAMYMQDRALDAEARKKYALSECEYLDGNSSKRMAAVISTLAGDSNQ